MTIDPTAFDRYRQSPNEWTTLPRLLFGTAITVALWVGMTMAVLFGGTYFYVIWQVSIGGSPLAGGAVQNFLASPQGILTALATFSGIWLGLWIAMRWVHGEPLAALVGASRRVSRSGFLKGLVAVLITSLLSEILLYLLQPEIARGAINLSTWLLFLLPIVALTLLQTSSEEALFRGYLLRGLANRFSSPFIWALAPGLLFTSLHWSSSSSAAMSPAGWARASSITPTSPRSNTSCACPCRCIRRTSPAPTRKKSWQPPRWPNSMAARPS